MDNSTRDTDTETAAPPPAETESPDTGPSEITPVLGDLLSLAMRRLVQRGRAELGRAARSGRVRLELRQAQRDLDHFWVRLGKSAYHLVDAGEVDHPALRKAMDRIDALEARINEIAEHGVDALEE